MIVVQGPGLYEVLGELGVGEEAHGVRHNLNIAPGKLLQLEVDLADLATKSCCHTNQRLEALATTRYLQPLYATIRCNEWLLNATSG